MALPDKLKNAPTLHMGLEFYFNAFKELSTCRVSTFSLGCITYFMCCEYCDRNNVTGDQREDFIVIIQAMDDAYMKYVNSKKPASKSDPKENDG